MRSSGFTLVEILVVLITIAIVLGVAMVNLLQARRTAQDRPAVLYADSVYKVALTLPPLKPVGFWFSLRYPFRSSIAYPAWGCVMHPALRNLKNHRAVSLWYRHGLPIWQGTGQP